MHLTIPSLNSGSSSLKLAHYSFCNGEVSKLASAAAEEIGGEAGKVWLRRGSRVLIDESRSYAGATEAAKYLITVLRNNSFPTPQIVGHRIVHGGHTLRKHQWTYSLWAVPSTHVGRRAFYDTSSADCGRLPQTTRPGLAEGIEFLPDTAPWLQLLSVKQRADHLYLRYRATSKQ